MRVVFDTNVVLDVLLDRAPFAEVAAQLMVRVEQGAMTGLLGATTVTTISYLAAKVGGRKAARERIANLLRLFEIAPVTRSVLERALELGFGDFEDAVLHEAGREAGATAIVTRDAKGFTRGSLAVFTPAQLLAASDSRE